MIPLALALVFGVLFIRALPWPEAWKHHKPLSCDACCVGWSLMGSSPWWAASYETVLAAGGLALLLLALHGWLKGSSLVPPGP
jgi:hypothetical protein